MRQDSVDVDRSWYDYDERGPWELPHGAQHILKRIAAEQIFLELVDVVPNHPSFVNHAEIACLLQQFPELCQKTFELEWFDNETRTLHPLSILCCLQPPLDLLQLAYQIYPKALYHTESVKNTMAFHYLCAFEASLEAVEWMMDLDFNLVQTARNDGMLPLHLASYFRARLEVVQHLIEAYPKALEQTDNGSWNILHAAAAGKASLDIVRLIHVQRPASILELDARGRSPLHLIVWQQGIPANVVSFLLERSPQTLNARDTMHETPLFRAIQCQPEQILRLLLPENPPLNQEGACLLHLAILENTCQVVEYLLERYPFMALVRLPDNATQYTPLHQACRWKAPLENVQALVKKAPETLFLESGRGKLPIDLARENGGDEGLIDYLSQVMVHHGLLVDQSAQDFQNHTTGNASVQEELRLIRLIEDGGYYHSDSDSDNNSDSDID